MARVVLDVSDLDPGGLTCICMACGAPATVEKRKQFSYHPLWVAALLVAHIGVYAYAAEQTTKRCEVWMPFCSGHARYWGKRTAILVAGFAGVVLALVTWMLLAPDSPTMDRPWWRAAGVAILVALCVWMIACVIVHATAIRLERITESKIGLLGIHPTFVSALQQHRAKCRAWWELEWARRTSGKQSTIPPWRGGG